MSILHQEVGRGLELWGGVECTVNRVEDVYVSQLDRSGHRARDSDIALFAGAGLSVLRYPVLWEQVAPDGLASADWSWPDARLAQLRACAVRPVIGLTHHGSGPRHTSLLDPQYPVLLARYAGAVAARYPWVDDYTPVNEPLTTARFSCLYGYWHPHGKSDGEFLRALFNQCRGVVMSMEAIRAVNPAARLVQTEDMGTTYGTGAMAGTVAFYNERRWLSWDLLAGRIDPAHPLWRYLRDGGLADDELLWFRDRKGACTGAPDLLGINYYVTSDRWLDQRVALYPPHLQGDAGFVDVEACRVMALPSTDVGALLDEAWARYGIPLVISECHLDASRENQMRWLYEIWRAAEGAQTRGVDVRAVCAWSLLGAFDWNSLLTRDGGYYESGAFDVSEGVPRATALLPLMRELAQGRAPSHPALPGAGWWRLDSRVCHPSGSDGMASATQALAMDVGMGGGRRRPLWLLGGAGHTGALESLCGRRDLDVVLQPDQPSDAARLPWAIVCLPSRAALDDVRVDLPGEAATAAAQLGVPLLVLYGPTAARLGAANGKGPGKAIFFRCQSADGGATEAELNAGLDLLIDGVAGHWRIGDNGHGVRDVAAR